MVIRVYPCSSFCNYELRDSLLPAGPDRHRRLAVSPLYHIGVLWNFLLNFLLNYPCGGNGQTLKHRAFTGLTLVFHSDSVNRQGELN